MIVGHCHRCWRHHRRCRVSDDIICHPWVAVSLLGWTSSYTCNFAREFWFSKRIQFLVWYSRQYYHQWWGWRQANKVAGWAYWFENAYINTLQIRREGCTTISSLLQNPHSKLTVFGFRSLQIDNEGVWILSLGLNGNNANWEFELCNNLYNITEIG